MRRNTAALPMPQTTGYTLAHRLYGANTTTTLQTSPARFPPPWGRAGVGAAKKCAAPKLHRTSPFTYTFPATLYVKTTIGCALAHRLPSDTTTAARPPADLLPPPLRASPCRGGRFSPIITARFPPPWPSSHAKYDHIVRGAQRRVGVRLHTANAKSPAVLHSPPWERVGVGAAKKHAATQPHRTSSFT